MALHHGAMSLSAVCDCRISWPYSLTILMLVAANIMFNPYAVYRNNVHAILKLSWQPPPFKYSETTYRAKIVLKSK